MGFYQPFSNFIDENNTNTNIMGAPKGNNYWQFRNKHGRDFIYQPEELWQEAVAYAVWIEENPLKEENLFAFQGVITKDSAAKMRAMTLTGFFLFADISHTTFDNYKLNKDFIEVTTRIENMIYTQKLEGAAAGLLNANIIARDLGLKEQVNQTGTTTQKVIVTDKKTADDLERLRAKFESE